MTGLSRRSIIAGAVTGAAASVLPVDDAAPLQPLRTSAADAELLALKTWVDEQILIAHGWMTPDQVRAAEGLPLVRDVIEGPPTPDGFRTFTGGAVRKA